MAILQQPGDKLLTGAVKSQREGKGRYDLLSPEFLRRLAVHMELGANHRGDRNWEKGIPISRCVDSALRHLFQYLTGDVTEDHIAAAAFWLQAIAHFERHLPEMQDLPSKMRLTWTPESMNTPHPFIVATPPKN